MDIPSESHLPSDGVVTLSFFRPADAAVLCAADHDPEHRRRFDCPAEFVPSLAHSEQVISKWEEQRRTLERFAFAVRNAASGALLGGCELKPLEDDTANLSYWTYPAYRLQGIASRAVTLVCGVAFTQLGLHRLEVVTDFDNLASRRVAIRSGFAEIGTRDGRVLHVRDSAGAGLDRSGPTTWGRPTKG